MAIPLPASLIPAGSYAPPAGDRANAVLTGQFTTTGQSPYWQCTGSFNVVFGATGGPNGNWTGSIQLERSFDGGTRWFVCGVGGSGSQAVYNTANQDVSIVVSEPEEGVAYRLNCTTLSSGTINYRFSTTGTNATAFGIS